MFNKSKCKSKSIVKYFDEQQEKRKEELEEFQQKLQASVKKNKEENHENSDRHTENSFFSELFSCPETKETQKLNLTYSHEPPKRAYKEIEENVPVDVRNSL
jgi:hypothetical protein